MGKNECRPNAKNCNDAVLVAFNEKELRIPFIWKILAPMMKNMILKKAQFEKNSPTAKEFKYDTNFDFEVIKNELITNFSRFQSGFETISCKKHPFWGYMTADEWNNLHWKHIDHHLRQFGV
jgi:hypothetical protein